jgi:hypothetical protein
LVAWSAGSERLLAGVTKTGRGLRKPGLLSLKVEFKAWKRRRREEAAARGQLAKINSLPTEGYTPNYALSWTRTFWTKKAQQRCLMSSL